MADPRKTYTVKYCPRGQVEQQGDQARRKGFIDSITKVGQLEFLNEDRVGAGDIREGLETLGKVSDSIRVGESTVPGREGTETYNTLLGRVANTAKEAVDQGAQIVLDATGLGGAVGTVLDFNPDVANRGYEQAQAIWDKVKDGKFTQSDIPETFSDLQNLEQLARGIFGTSDERRNKEREFALCSASPYATDLIAYAPKFNFLFVIDVQFAPEYADWSTVGSTMSFVVKRSTRPAVEFEYEEINMYNFWTRVPKRVIYPPITMSFYDDNKNAAHLFYTAYTRAMSPIANVNRDTINVGGFEQDSMNFVRGPDASTFSESSPTLNGYTASLGPLIGDANSVIRRIRLYHIFDYGRLMNIYNFFNPRILSFTPTDLNMAETGDGAEFDFQFVSDGMFIEPGYSIHSGQVSEGEGQPADKNITFISGNRETAKYPIRPIFDDLTFTSENSQQSMAPIAQEQAKGGVETNEQMARTLDSFSISTTSASSGKQLSTFDKLTGQATGVVNQVTGRIENFASGVTGAINDVQTSLGKASSFVSNAFTKTKNFTGSFFG